jgi:hypothetical protein
MLLQDIPWDIQLLYFDYSACLSAMGTLPPRNILELIVSSHGPLISILPNVVEAVARREVEGPSLFYGMEN